MNLEISKTEFEVLDAIWQQYPCSASDIVSRLNQRKEWHEKTVKTLLGRLVKKGALSFEKQQRHYLYSPCVAREEFTVKESQSFIQRLFGGRLSPLVATFAKHDSLTQKDIDELKQVIKQWEQERE